MEEEPGEGSRPPAKLLEHRRSQSHDTAVRPSRISSLEQALRDNLALGRRLELEAVDESAEACLKRLLSLKSIISTTSSFAERQQAAVGTNAIFREIGTGSIGKVFEHPGTTFVYKLPVSDQPEKLWNNYVMHKRIQHSFEALPYLQGQVEIPKCFWYATPSTASFWNQHLDRFPESDQFSRKRRHVLCMERIFPLPRPIRHALIDKYCPSKGQDWMKQDESNKDCLIRPYLGRIRYGAGGQFFTLRNFKLHANQIRELDLDVHELYNGMANALAIIHWHTGIDGMDIEFVLGSSPSEEQRVRNQVDLSRVLRLRPQSSTYEEATHSQVDFTRRVTSLWMIDFDDCQDITMDSAGVDKAARAFLDTNHYCPKPNTGDDFIEATWRNFGDKYIKYSDYILRNVLNKPELTELPRQFLKKLSDMTAPTQQQQDRSLQDTPAAHGGDQSQHRGRSSGSRP